MTRLHHLPPAAIALAGIVIAQLHGGPFWVGLLGSPVLGWAVSLTWESASVWLWWRGDSGWLHQWAKWGATAALLIGMVYQGASPLLVAVEGHDRIGRALKTEQVTLRRLLTAAVDQERRGWKDSIDAVRDRIIKLESLRIRPEAPAWVSTGTAWATLVLFPLLYGLALLAITTISGEFGTIQGSLKMPDKELVGAYAARHGLTSQASIAEYSGVHPGTLSEFIRGISGPQVTIRIREKLR